MARMTADDLTTSRELRDRTVTKIDVLDKVGALALLPDDVHTTVMGVARYYEVDTAVIKHVVERNMEEMVSNGLRALRGAELKQFKQEMRARQTPSSEAPSESTPPLTRAECQPGTTTSSEPHLTLTDNVSSLRVFTRRTTLNVGQLLTESTVARDVRAYLLNVEAAAPVEARMEAAGLSALTPSRHLRQQEKFTYKQFRGLMRDNMVDYDKKDPRSQAWYQNIQNQLYVCVTGMTASQIKRGRPVRVELCSGKRGPTVADESSAKNYLTDHELNWLHRIERDLFHRADDISSDGLSLTMDQWNIIIAAELSLVGHWMRVLPQMRIIS